MHYVFCEDVRIPNNKLVTNVKPLKSNQSLDGFQAFK